MTEGNLTHRGSVAVVAFSFRPASGSEWGVGWDYVRMLSGIFRNVTLAQGSDEACRAPGGRAPA